MHPSAAVAVRAAAAVAAAARAFPAEALNWLPLVLFKLRESQLSAAALLADEPANLAAAPLETAEASRARLEVLKT
eukprot:1072676-Prorocentrum_minimum.AAC.1